jgi:hypothetical protein
MFLDFIFKKKNNRRAVSVDTVKNIEREWGNINVLLSQKGPSQLRQGLISADKTLDNALRDLVDGNTMGDKLKEAEKYFDKYLYNKIWEAHKLRNNIVHESGFEPPYFMVTEAVQTFRNALYALGVKV